MRNYIETLIKKNNVNIVERSVDPRFELAAVTAAAQKENDHPTIFRNVLGSNLPVVINLYGSNDRLCRLIGAGDNNFCRHWTEITKALGHGPADDATTIVSGANDIKTVALSDLPQITYFERDGGPYFTAGIFLAREPGTGIANMSFHRAMYINDKELRIRLGSTHDFSRYQAKAEEAGEVLEAAMLLGPPPEIFVSACASLPYDADEIAAAAMIRGAPVPMRQCETIDLMVPDETEIVVEGRIIPHERRPEGPFGEFMGYYVPVGDNHVFEVTHVSRREGAYFQGLLCGSPDDMRPLELSIASRIYRHLINQVPGVIDVTCHPTLINTVVKIDKQYDDHARHVLLAAFGAHMDYSKACMVVDEDVDIYDLRDVIWAYLTRGRADKRAFILDDMPGFYRDPHRDHYGRLAIDATKPWGREAEFERKLIPGAENINLNDYLAR